MTASLVHVREIVAVLDHETRLASELHQALLSQRAAVASADGPRVNDSVDAVGRALHMLDAARRQRTALLERLDGRTLADFATTAEPNDRAELEAARARLRGVAEDVTRAAGINRQVLRRSMEAGEAFLQELFASVGGPAACYRPDENPDAGRQSAGVLLNRTA